MNIAIIPARANSKAIPNKNLKKIGSHSLLGWSILAAIESRCFDKIIVTTDGNLIMDEARIYGVNIVVRPPELALDNARSIDAIKHTINYLGINEGTCVLLQPTSPFRNSGHIVAALEDFNRKKVKSLIFLINYKRPQIGASLFLFWCINILSRYLQSMDNRHSHNQY